MPVDEVLKHCDISAKAAAKLACWLSHMPDLKEPGPQTAVGFVLKGPREAKRDLFAEL